MNLLQIIDGSIIFGQPPLLDHANLHIHEGERLCILGRNGSGKSTLLKVIASEIPLDDGQLLKSRDVKISRLSQDPPQRTDVLIFDYVAEGLADNADLIKRYNTQTSVVAENPTEEALNKLQVLQDELETKNAWVLEQRIHQLLTEFALDANQNLSSLSGGWRRKAALARAMVQDPDILLLDEPTNHLDIDTVKWLEKTIMNFRGTTVFISHDRAFIRRLSTRILDIDRGKVTSYDTDYDNYLVRKAEDLDVELQHNNAFDKKLAQEEVWIRQGIKARRTRNEGRVRALKALREEFKARRNVTGKAVISSNTGQKSGKRIFELENVSYKYGDHRIVDNLDLLIARGDKLALIGPNGSGKTTFIKLLLGELTPDQGEIIRGTNIEVAYFDQHRSQLDLEKTVIDTVADGKRELVINGNNRHVMSYLQDYLFTPERVNVPVKALSGGEKNRLMLARLMLKPNNLLILDEPTNDLDVETLELLESLLVDYQGTLILVSHDRVFIDNVVTSCLSFENNGTIRQFVGGYSDVEAWYQQRDSEQVVKSVVKNVPTTENISENKSNVAVKSQKLSFNEKRELSELPKLIDDLEIQISEIQGQINQVDFFQQDVSETQPILDKLALLEEKLDTSFERWQLLEDKNNNA
ncbi:ATP-binding cassette ATPase Uup [Glaciecola sp. 1036]|uniref:ATP-binding cassette ATPase Uup n=1 Tax=Alteromonadaceae TaxID=72275 RepID=UPI003D034D17